jgi:hypothetical protein
LFDTTYREDRVTRYLTYATLCLAGLVLVGAPDVFAQDEGGGDKSDQKSMLSLPLRKFARPRSDGVMSPRADSLLTRWKLWRPSKRSVDPDMVIRPDPSLHFDMPVLRPDPSIDREMIYPRERAYRLFRKKLKY